MRLQPTHILPLLTASQIWFSSVTSSHRPWSFNQSAYKKLQGSALSATECKGRVGVVKHQNEQPVRLAWLIVLMYTSRRPIESPWKENFLEVQMTLPLIQYIIVLQKWIQLRCTVELVQCTCFSEEESPSILVLFHQRDKQLKLSGKRQTKANTTRAEQWSQLICPLGEQGCPLFP